jgi:hypothetical protein
MYSFNQLPGVALGAEDTSVDKNMGFWYKEPVGWAEVRETALTSAVCVGT